MGTAGKVGQRQKKALSDGDFSGRVSLKGMNALPEVGKNFDLLLFEEGKILSVFGGGRGIGTGAPLGAPGLAEKEEACLARFLWDAGGMAAFPLTGTRGYAVVYGLPGFPGRGLGVLPYAPGASVERVMARSFGQITADFDPAELPRKMREDDGVTYEFLGSVTALWRRICKPPAGVETSARRARFLWEEIALLTGTAGFPAAREAEETGKVPPPRPLPGAAVGFCLLCLGVGLCRAFPKGYGKAAVLIGSGGSLSLTVPAGNRTRIPPEWEAAGRLAAACDMHFSVTRRRDAVEADFRPAERARTWEEVAVTQ